MSRSVATIKQGHGGQPDAVVTQAVDMHDSREVERLFKFDFLSQRKSPFQGGKIVFIGCEKLFQHNLGLFDRLKQGNQS